MTAFKPGDKVTKRRADLFRSLGCEVTVERSRQVEWPL